MSGPNDVDSSAQIAELKRLLGRGYDRQDLGRHFAIVEVVNLTRRVYSLAVSGLMVLCGVHTAAAQTYVETGIQGAGTQHVIITVTPGHENDVLDTLRKHGGRVTSQHPSINGVAADITGLASSCVCTRSPIITSMPPVPLVIATHPPYPNGVGVLTFATLRR